MKQTLSDSHTSTLSPAPHFRRVMTCSSTGTLNCTRPVISTSVLFQRRTRRHVVVASSVVVVHLSIWRRASPVRGRSMIFQRRTRRPVIVASSIVVVHLSIRRRASPVRGRGQARRWLVESSIDLDRDRPVMSTALIFPRRTRRPVVVASSIVVLVFHLSIRRPGRASPARGRGQARRRLRVKSSTDTSIDSGRPVYVHVRRSVIFTRRTCHSVKPA